MRRNFVSLKNKISLKEVRHTHQSIQELKLDEAYKPYEKFPGYLYSLTSCFFKYMYNSTRPYFMNPTGGCMKLTFIYIYFFPSGQSSFSKPKEKLI